MQIGSARWPVVLFVSALLAANVAISARLFGVETSAYHESVEGAFIANARVMAEHPGASGWWPIWGCGMPIENSYLPLTQWSVAAFSLLTHLSAARSFHIVSAGFYVLFPLTLFWLALALSGRRFVSFLAALAYSCFSLSAVLLPNVGRDLGGVLNLRRLQTVVFYGETPHLVAMTFVPVAVLLFHRALTRGGVKWWIAGGVAAGLTALSNAFGIVWLGISLACLLLAYPSSPWWKGPAKLAVVGAATYCWVSPWLTPGLLRTIGINSPDAGGDFHYTAASWAAVAVGGVGMLALWWVLCRAKVAAHLQFFLFMAYVPTAILIPWELWQAPVIAQPLRYHIEMEVALMLLLVFGAAAILDRFPRSVRTAVVVVTMLALVLQTGHSVRYARGLIRAVDPNDLVEYRIAKWLDQNRHGERAFPSGSTSILFNDFTDNPQVFGAHEPLVANRFVRIAAYTIYSGANAGARDTEYSVFWLKAFGARSISVSGPKGREFWKPFANPRKFEGVLPVIWREGDDTIYEVPSRSASLAHVMPRSAVVGRTPIHGLDIGPAEAYVAALDDAQYPQATFTWKGMSEAEIRARVEPGQVIAVQETYNPGWAAYSNGRRQRVRGDGIGLMVIEPDCQDCVISLHYDGGTERIVTRGLSLAAMLAAAVAAWVGKRKRLAKPASAD